MDQMVMKEFVDPFTGEKEEKIKKKKEKRKKDHFNGSVKKWHNWQ